MTRAADVREPFYFGRARRLYGCLHPSAAQVPRRTAVLICAPLGQEAIRAHRSLLQLAVRLARGGFAAMRFDWSGTGDSEGNLDAHGPQDWLADVGEAARELRRRVRPQSLALVGQRVGALLAARAAEMDPAGLPAALVLWDPIARGRRWVEELEKAHRSMLSIAYVDARRAAADGETVERLGFLYPSATLDALADLDVPQAGPSPARATLILEATEQRESAALAEAWRAGGADVRLQRSGGPRVWSEEPYKGLVPQGALDTAVRFLEEVCP